MTGMSCPGAAPLAQSDQQRQRAAPALTGEMNLAGQATPGTSDSLVRAKLPEACACVFSSHSRRSRPH